MGYIVAGLAIAAAGAGTSAYGTAQNAQATADQAQLNAYLENKFAKKWTANAQALEDDKLNKLYNIGSIFDRFQSSGAFGDTSTLENLRKAQEDFSLLAAGDFSRFDNQLRQVMKDNLVAAGGTGSPIGTYANLSADTILNFRRTGLSDAVALSGYLSGESMNLLNAEFGVLDRGFETRYGIDRNRLNAVTGNMMTAAQQTGVGTAAYGNALQQVGSSLYSYGMSGLSGTNTTGAPKAIPLDASGNAMGYSVGADGYYYPSATTVAAPISYKSVTPVGYSSYSPKTPIYPPLTPMNDSVYGNIPEIPPYYNPVDGENPLLPPAGTVGYGFTWEPGTSAPAGSLGYGYNPLNSVGASIVGR